MLRLRIKLQAAARLLAQRRTQQPPGLMQHEVDLFRRDELRRTNKVTLIFAILIIHQHDHLPRTQGGKNFRNLRERHWASFNPILP